MEEEIFARFKEKEVLKKIYESSSPSFIAIYGRRRVGKTFLVKKYFENKGIFFHVTGIKDAKMSVQLQNFAIELNEVFSANKSKNSPKDWHEAFYLLRKEIEKIGSKGKIVIFFDELPWLASPKSGFLQALDHFWNRHLSHMKNIILIVCGSAASWMINKVMNDRGGLHGRITHEIPLYPFNLFETNDFLKSKNIQLDLHQLIEIYMALGGVAKYLTFVKKGYSAAQMINELFFTKQGALVHEFNRLYQSLFNNYEAHVLIVKTLAKKSSGMTYRELIQDTKLPQGGSFTQMLRELQISGFIDTISTFNRGKRSQKYILTDEYTYFYLTWVSNLSQTELDDNTLEYWMHLRQKNQFEIWKGFAFERLCLKHIQFIKKAMGIGAVSAKISKWSSISTPNRKDDGAQIDFIIDRADHTINLCEVKCSFNSYEITKIVCKYFKFQKKYFQKGNKYSKNLIYNIGYPLSCKKK